MPVKLARLAALQHLGVRFLVELDLARAVHLLVHVHAVDHFADGVFQAGRILFKLDHLLIEVLRQHKSLPHVVLHRGHAHRFLLLLDKLPLVLVARQLRAVHARGNLVLGNPGVHGPRLDGLDQALDGQRHGIGAVAELQRRLANLLQDRLRRGRWRWRAHRAAARSRSADRCGAHRSCGSCRSPAKPPPRSRCRRCAHSPCSARASARSPR